MIVDGGRVHSGLHDDPAQRDAFDAVFGKEGLGRVENLLFGVCHNPRIAEFKRMIQVIY